MPHWFNARIQDKVQIESTYPSSGVLVGRETFAPDELIKLVTLCLRSFQTYDQKNFSKGNYYSYTL